MYTEKKERAKMALLTQPSVELHFGATLGSFFRGRAFIFLNMIVKEKSGSTPPKKADFQN